MYNKVGLLNTGNERKDEGAVRRMNAIFVRMFVVFLLITLPLEAVQFTMYFWSRDSVRQELLGAAVSNVTYLRETFEESIVAVNRQLEYLLQNYTVLEFFVYGDHAYYTPSAYNLAIRQINTLLRFLRDGSTLLSEVRLYYPSLSTRLSSREDIYYADVEAVEPIISALRQQTWLFTEHAGELLVGHMYPSIAYRRDVLPQYMAVAVLDEAAVLSQLTAYNAYNDGNALMVNHVTGSVRTGNEALRTLTAGALPLMETEARDGPHSTQLTLAGNRYVAAYTYSAMLNCSFIQLIPASRIEAIPDLLMRFMILFVALALLLMLLYAVVTKRLINRPIRDLTRAFTAEGSGDFGVRVTGRYANEFITLADNFNRMSDQLADLIERDYKHTILLQRAELKQLQAQINPHFFYNCFFLLRHLIDGDRREEAMRLARHLGEYYRYISTRQSDELPLSEEYGHAATYLSIQHMRFGAGTRMEIVPLPPSLADGLVPRLILQPILENALEYGVPTTDTVSVVRLLFDIRADGHYCITVEDNGDRLTDARIGEVAAELTGHSSGDEAHALVNIHRRIQLYFGNGCGLSVSRSGLGGLCVTMTLRKGETK